MPPTPPHPAAPGWNPWPYGIVAAFVIFVTAIIGLIIFTSHHGQDLVSADYYERELRYQQQLDGLERTSALGGQASARYDRGTDSIQIVLPAGHAEPRPEGRIELYRPSAADEDRTLALAVDAQARQQLDARALSTGPWRVRVLWKHEGADFILEEKIVVRTNAPATRRAS